MYVSAKKLTIKSDFTTEGRHIGPVWDVTWDPTVDTEVEEPHIISAGSDGKLVQQENSCNYSKKWKY